MWLSAAGILHFVVGRSLFFNCIQLAGANISGIMVGASPLVAVSLGISVLNEPLTWELATGALLIVCGVMAVGLNPQMFRSGGGLLSGIPRKAFLFGIGAGLSWGISPILIKVGLSGSGSPVAGALISYSAATIALSLSLWKRNRITALVGMKGRVAGLFGLASLLSSTAQLMVYVALSMGAASAIAPIISISPVFQLVLSFLLNRKLEVFHPVVIIGTIAVVAGAILVF